MVQWYVKDLSKLTKVSVQTLHHYDKIGLLKPSVRLSNGYRLYSEQDLLKLQQIIALKFFGFELVQIKRLLKQEVEVIDHFVAQAKLLQEKAEAMLEAHRTLEAIIDEHSVNKSIPWEAIIQLIEVYRMTQELSKSWAGKIFDSEELKQFASFQKEMETRYTPAEKAAWEKNWFEVINQIKSNLNTDPASAFGIKLGERCMVLVNDMYGKKYAKLKKAIWEKGFKKQQLEPEDTLPPEVVTWMDKAIDSYYKGRIYGILAEVGKNDPEKVLALWNTMSEEMYGDEEIEKKALVQAALKDKEVSVAAKDWLKKTFK